ncbi:tripartite tricarboxylate transporter substrate binding protein [Falsiroseomonas oryzae]|uniref:tripartite tricarboxylate transporter substrate binding protein n=1 Tax=Falsiroseomonas oryzae TaxID=2766473 RepID=UPI0022EB8D9A|nr:tripartite tricarboxylate transporter substrate binding protein [Roseomonas sp. MO-31]
MTFTRRRALLTAGSALALPALPALGQPRFPERPIEIVVGFTAGGGTDLMARTYARFLEQRLGGSVVVLNRPGAGGEVAYTHVARARPDGHTLMAVTMPALLTIPIERNAQYRADQLTPIALIATDPCSITVHEQSPVRSLADLLDRARREPDRVTFASSGVGTDDHLQIVLLQEAAGVRFTHVGFPGSAQVRTALLGRQVDSMGLNVGEIAAAPENVRMIVQAGERRSRFAPDVPTYKELGFDVDISSERGISAPAGTPPAVLDRLREATADIARDAEFIKAMEALYTEMRVLIGEAWGAELRQRQARFEALWQRTPWRERS